MSEIKRIGVVGFPRSGTHWLLWLLSDVFEARINETKHVWKRKIGNDYNSMIELHHRHFSGYKVPAIAMSENSLSKCFFIIRDVRDVVVSRSRYWKRSISDAVSEVYTWSDYVNRWANTDRVYYVTYESLFVDCASALTDLLSRSGDVEFAKRACLSCTSNSYSEKKRRFAKHNQWKPERYFGGGGIGKWRHLLDNETLRSIYKQHGETMQRFGYTVGEYA